MMARGEYTPLLLDEAVERSAEVLRVFSDHGVKCLRIGLCESENLHSDAYLAGPNHPAMGEMVGSRLYWNRISAELDRYGEDLSGAELVISVSKGDISLAVGQKKGNKLEIIKKYHVKSVRFIENADLIRYNIILDVNPTVGRINADRERKTED